MGDLLSPAVTVDVATTLPADVALLPAYEGAANPTDAQSAAISLSALLWKHSNRATGGMYARAFPSDRTPLNDERCRPRFSEAP